MPKKSTTKKTVAAKKVFSRTRVSKTSTINPSFFVAEQEEFHKQHPNANNLIAIFLISVFVLALLFLKKMY